MGARQSDVFGSIGEGNVDLEDGSCYACCVQVACRPLLLSMALPFTEAAVNVLPLRTPKPSLLGALLTSGSVFNNAKMQMDVVKNYNWSSL